MQYQLPKTFQQEVSEDAQTYTYILIQEVWMRLKVRLMQFYWQDTSCIAKSKLEKVYMVFTIFYIQIHIIIKIIKHFKVNSFSCNTFTKSWLNITHIEYIEYNLYWIYACKAFQSNY